MRHAALPALLVGLGMMLAACQPVPQEAPYPGTPDGRVDLAACGGGPVLALMGQNVSDMPATGGWGTLRVIWPGMAVTEDYSESRLNVDVDVEGRIIGVHCG